MSVPEISLAHGESSVCITRANGEPSHHIEGLTPEQVAGVMELCLYWGTLSFQIGQKLATPAEPSRILVPGVN